MPLKKKKKKLSHKTQRSLKKPFKRISELPHPSLTQPWINPLITFNSQSWILLILALFVDPRLSTTTQKTVEDPSDIKTKDSRSFVRTVHHRVDHHWRGFSFATKQKTK